MGLQTTLPHKERHATSGTDALTPADIGAEPAITTLPVSRGGTGSTTAANALTALGAVAKSGDTMGGKLIAAADNTSSKLNIGNAITETSPASITNGDLWITSGNRMAWRSNAVSYNSAATTLPNTFNQAQSISLASNSTAAALKISNLGSGDCLRIEDEPAASETTPFVVNASGKVGIGVEPDETVALSVNSTGIKFSDGSVQTTAIWKSVSINSATTNIPTGRHVYAAPIANFVSASNPATVNLPTGTGVADGDVFVIEYNDGDAPFVEVNVNQSGSTLLTIDASGGVYFFRYLRGWKLEEARHNIPREWVDAGETIASGGSVSLPETLIGKWTNINATGTGTLTVTLPTLLPSVFDTARLSANEISRLAARIGISFPVNVQNGTQYNRKAVTVRVPTAIEGVFTTVLSLPAVSNGDVLELRRQIHYVFRVDADTGSWVLNEQEQADWSQTDNTQPDFIKNKPTIPSAPTIFTGSNGTSAGTAGLVPLPAATDNTKFLKGDGTWSTGVSADALWNFRGAYGSGDPYAVGDVATFGGRTWYRIHANGGNVGDTPSEGTFWTLIADKGDTGDAGPAPAGTGIVTVVDGALQTPQTLDGIGALGFSTDSYIIARPGDNLATKYADAKVLTPQGSAKSATNRASLIVFPGAYSLDAELVIDTEFVDIIGLGAQFQSPTVFVTNNTLNVTANNVRVSGISVGAQQFKIGNNKPLQIFENCTGGNLSFGSESALTVSGFFKGCVGADDSFGGYFGTVGGTFTDCAGGAGSFAGSAHGEFNNCTGGNGSFGGGGGIASGTFTDCVGSGSSFGGGGTGSATGNFTNCVGDASCFGSALASGTFTNCTADYYSFARRGIASGNFINCKAADDSFGGDGGEAKGYFINCNLTSGEFPPLTSNPPKKVRMINCVDGSGNIIEGWA